MSCDRRCTDAEDDWFGHEDCNTCQGRDDGQSMEQYKKDAKLFDKNCECKHCKSLKEGVIGE